MTPGSQARKKRNSSKVNLAISFSFHAILILALVYFAARQGLLGKQLKKIAVEMVKEKKPPEKPKEPEKPKDEIPKPEEPKIAEAPKVVTPRLESPPPSSADEAPPAAAPPAAELPSFVFEGGATVSSTSDPNTIYKGSLEYGFRSHWNRPTDMDDDSYVAEVEVAVSRDGQISNAKMIQSSGDQRWDDSVRKAIAAVKSLDHPPPANFPSRIIVRFDVQETAANPVFQ